jgi:hypothetical protein
MLLRISPETETAYQVTDPRKLSLFLAVDRDLSLFSGFDSEPQPDCLGDGD